MEQQDPIEFIARLIETKSNIKQVTYRNLCSVFKKMKKEAASVIEKVNKKIEHKDKDIRLSVLNMNDQEFHLKIAGDLIVFLMHTNIVTLDNEHGFSKSEYVQSNISRKYLGQINIYNFMADSFKYNRINDPGYLIARFFINHENHFLVEGEKQLSFLFEGVSAKPVNNTDLNVLIQLVLSQSIESDLITVPFPKIRTITLGQKIEKTRELGSGYKIGFQLGQNNEIV